MMAIDKWTKGLALGQLAKPVNLVGTGKRLGQPEDCQKETETQLGSHQQPQALRRVSEDQHSSEVQQQGSNLHQNESGRVGIKR